MIDIRRVSKDELKKYSQSGYENTIFTTYEWISFLEKNQKAESVILELYQKNKLVGIFVGLTVKKFGIKILGSPFEGWLTPDMGFIYIDSLDINDALQSVARYAFKSLKCMYVQVCDKKIRIENLNNKIKYHKGTLLHLPISSNIDGVIEGFTKNGRRDVRASTRKGIDVKTVPFDKDFVDIYYSQLVDVFSKQNLKPFYGIDKLYDLVDSFKDSQEKVLALIALTEDNECVATVMSFGFNQWGYYIGAASYRNYQKFLPNERLFLSFVEHWGNHSVSDLDLVGYREYKMKYNPTLVEIPVIYFERIPGLIVMKNLMRRAISLIRKIRGK